MAPPRRVAPPIEAPTSRRYLPAKSLQSLVDKHSSPAITATQLPFRVSATGSPSRTPPSAMAMSSSTMQLDKELPAVPAGRSLSRSGRVASVQASEQGSENAINSASHTNSSDFNLGADKIEAATNHPSAVDLSESMARLSVGSDSGFLAAPSSERASSNIADSKASRSRVSSALKSTGPPAIRHTKASELRAQASLRRVSGRTSGVPSYPRAKTLGISGSTLRVADDADDVIYGTGSIKAPKQGITARFTGFLRRAPPSTAVSTPPLRAARPTRTRGTPAQATPTPTSRTPISLSQTSAAPAATGPVDLDQTFLDVARHLNRVNEDIAYYATIPGLSIANHKVMRHHRNLQAAMLATADQLAVQTEQAKLNRRSAEGIRSVHRAVNHAEALAEEYQTAVAASGASA